MVAYPVSAGAGLALGMLDTVDCTMQDMLSGSYAALAVPTGPIALAVTGALTLYVGFFGLRLITGRGSVDVGGLTMMAVKIGLVVVLAGNWAVYQQLVSKTLFNSPQQIAEIMLSGFHRPSSVLSPDSFTALQQSFDELIRDVRSLASHAGDRSPLLGGAAFATMVLNASAYGLVFASAGTISVVHIGLTILLALGPVIAGLLLFEATRGLVEGWARAMVALALVSLAILLLLPIELSMLEPTLIALAQQRATDAITPETAVMAAFIVSVFIAGAFGSIFVAWTIARGIRLPAAATQERIAQISGAAAPVRPVPILHRAEHIAAQLVSDRSGLAERRAARASQSMVLRSAHVVDARGRTEGSASGEVQLTSVHRAARPRRELLVARRKR